MRGVTYDVTLDEHLLHLPESLAVRAGLVDLTKRHVHKVVAFDEMTVECHAVLELDELFRRQSSF